MYSHSNWYIKQGQTNAIWDEPDKFWGHSQVVSLLNKNNLTSLYHHQNKLSHGQEKHPTFLQYRNPQKPYHIDYFFLHKSLLDISKLEVLEPYTWLPYSDHAPLVASLNI